MKILSFILAMFAGLAFASESVGQCGPGGCGAGRASSSKSRSSMSMASKYNGGRSMSMQSRQVAMHPQQEIHERIIRVPAEPRVEREIIRNERTIIREQPQFVERQVFVQQPQPLIVQQPLLIANEPVGFRSITFGARGRVRSVTTSGGGYGSGPALIVGPRGRLRAIN